MLIESSQNQKVKKWVKLKQKKYRSQLKEFIVEGEHLVLEAIQMNRAKEILLKEDVDLPVSICIDKDIPVYKIKASIFTQIASTETPQPIMAVCEIIEHPITHYDRLLLLDRVQDPGNLGTLIRSAVAFNFNGVILGDGCVDLYNEKVIRSTQGAIFKIPVVQRNLIEEICELKARHVVVYGTALENGQPLNDFEVSKQMAFVLGNEGSGVDGQLLQKTDQNIFIEMSKNIESLNVSIAGSIIMHHFRL